jgi:hypothetical protein
MSIVNPNCFEKTKEAWGIFSFFSSTNVETKNVCPIAYNTEIFATHNPQTHEQTNHNQHKTSR